MTGGGDSKHFAEIDQHFIGLLGDSPKLLFIPLAGSPKSWENGLKRIKQTFKTIQFDKIEMCIDLADLRWKYLKNFDAIYIDGGNTFRLMNEIRHTHFYELLHRFLHNGGVVNGDSAGAIILGSHLETAHFGESPDENQSDVISYQGLNLLGSYAIHCHYDESEEKEVRKFVKKYGFPVMALHEDTAIAIDGKTLRVFGNSPATIFGRDGVYKVLPLQEVNLGDLGESLL